jgi:hypothetical protein
LRQMFPEKRDCRVLVARIVKPTKPGDIAADIAD